jgi:hypothetical protein
MFNKKLVTIIDKENSMYVGELSENTDSYYVIKNPVGIAYPKDPVTGQVTIAVVPIIYDGFLSPKSIKNGIELNFFKDNLKWYSSTIEFHEDFVKKYHGIFNQEQEAK